VLSLPLPAHSLAWTNSRYIDRSGSEIISWPSATARLARIPIQCSLSESVTKQLCQLVREDWLDRELDHAGCIRPPLLPGWGRHSKCRKEARGLHFNEDVRIIEFVVF
jgi:hypothetical protein